MSVVTDLATMSDIKLGSMGAVSDGDSLDLLDCKVNALASINVADEVIPDLAKLKDVGADQAQPSPLEHVEMMDFGEHAEVDDNEMPPHLDPEPSASGVLHEEDEDMTTLLENVVVESFEVRELSPCKNKVNGIESGIDVDAKSKDGMKNDKGTAAIGENLEQEEVKLNGDTDALSPGHDETKQRASFQTILLNSEDVNDNSNFELRKSSTNAENESNGVHDKVQSSANDNNCSTVDEDDLNASPTQTIAETESADKSSSSDVKKQKDTVTGTVDPDDAVLNTAMDGLWNGPVEGAQDLDDSAIEFTDATNQNISLTSDDAANNDLMGLTIVSVRGEVDNEYEGMQRENDPRIQENESGVKELDPSTKQQSVGGSHTSPRAIARKENFKRVKMQGPLSKRHKPNPDGEEVSEVSQEGEPAEEDLDLSTIMTKQPKICVEKLHLSESQSSSEGSSEVGDGTTLKLVQLKKDGIVQCPKCEKTPSNLSNLQVHLHKYHPELPLPYQCQHCQLYFLREISIRNHLKRDHGVENMDDAVQEAKTAINLELDELVPVASPSKKLISSPGKSQRTSAGAGDTDGEAVLEIVERSNGTLKCPDCEKTPSNMSNLQAHMQKHHPELPLPFICNYCGTYFLREITIKNHLFIKHHVVFTDEVRAEAQTHVTLDVVVWNAPIEPSSTVDSEMNSHSSLTPSSQSEMNTSQNYIEQVMRLPYVKTLESLERLDGTLQCPRCPSGKALSNWSNLQTHLQTYHPDLPLPYQCIHCNMYFLKEVSVRNHLLKEHGLSYTEEEQGHAKTVFEEDPSMPTLPSALGTVIKKEKDDDMEYASALQQSFVRQTPTRSLRAPQTEESPAPEDGTFSCPSCKKVYSSLGNVHRHIHQRHPNEPMPFNCKKCYKGFVKEETMRIHSLQCNKDGVFPQPQYAPSLDESANRSDEDSGSDGPDGAIGKTIAAPNHSDGRDKDCPICDRSFLRMRSLHDHIHLKHPDLHLPFQCNLCTKGFLKVDSIKIHMIRKHGIYYTGDGQQETFANHIPEFETSTAPTSQQQKQVMTEEDMLPSTDPSAGAVPSVHKDGRIKCTECNALILHWNNFRRHMNMRHPEVAAPYKCKYCTRDFFRKKSYILHLQVKHKIEDKASTEQFELPPNVTIKKEIGEILPASTAVAEEFSSKDFEMPRGTAYGMPNVKLKCPKCMLIKRSRKEMDAHFRRVHGPDQMPYQCDKCPGKGFFFKISYVSHCKLFHQQSNVMPVKPKSGKDVVYCIVIKEAGSPEDNLGDMKDDTPGSSPAAQLLPFSLPPPPPTPPPLIVPVAQPPPPVEDKRCPRCKKEFLEVRDVEVHYREAHAEKDMPHSCPICKIKFLFKSRRNNHLIRSHEVPEADLGDYDESDGDNQSNTKLDVKEILLAVDDNICPRCNESFANLAMLEDHFRETHEEEDLPFHCFICKKGFLMISQRKRHIAKNHSPAKALKATSLMGMIRKQVADNIMPPAKRQKHDVKEVVESEVTASSLTKAQCLNALKTLSCPLCAGKYSSVKQMLIHFRAMHNNKDLPYHCQICDRGFFAQSSCKKHFFRVHGDYYAAMYKSGTQMTTDALPTKAAPAPVKEEIRETSSRTNSSTFVGKNVLTEMEISKILETNSCPRCPSKFSHIKSLEVHFRINHNPADLPVHCQTCDKAFFTQPRCDNHIVKSHKSKPRTFPLSPSKQFSFMPRIVLKSQGDDTSTAAASKGSGSDTISEAEAQRAVEQGVCPRCSAKFSLIKNMIQHIQNVHPEVGLPYKCTTCTKEFLRKVHRWRHEVIVHKSSMHADIEADFTDDIKSGTVIMCNHHSKRELDMARKQFTCPVCGHSVRTVKSLDGHYTMCHDKNNMPYQCVPCKRGFFSVQTFWRHMSLHKSFNTTKSNLKPAIPTPNISRSKVAVQGLIKKYAKKSLVQQRVQCSECDIFFISMAGLRKHFRKYHDHMKMPYGCGQCGQRFFSEGEVQNHTKALHRNEAIVLHNKNEAEESSGATMLQCTNARIGPAKYKNVNKKCPVCDMRYSNIKGVENHFRKNHEESQMNYICSLCNRGFFKWTRLENHARKIHKTSSTYSPGPPRTFIHEASQRKDSSSNGPSVSSAAAFDTKKYLLLPFTNVCPQCEKSFDTPKGLDCHFRTYHPDVTMPFTCRFCAAGYFSWSRLVGHLKKNHKMTVGPLAQELSTLKNGNNRFVECPACESLFLNQITRDNHYRKVHDESNMVLRCHLCQKGYFSKDALLYHYKQFHEECDDAEARLEAEPDFEEVYGSLEGQKESENQDQSEDNQTEGILHLFCHVCFEVFGSQEILNAHLEENHEQKKEEPQEVSVIESPTRPPRLNALNTRDVTDKIKSKYGLKKHVCPKCGITFSTETTRLRHFRSLHGGDSAMPHRCTECEMGYLEKSSLLVHISRHHRPTFTSSKRYQEDEDCYISSQTKAIPKVARSKWAQLFSAKTGASSPDASSESMMEDIGSQDGSMEDEDDESVNSVFKINPNDVDPSSFGSPLKRSAVQTVQPILDKMKSQFGGKFQCTECDRSFYTESEKNKHITTMHGDDRPHKCPVCNRGYIQLPYLKKHMTQSGHNMAQFRAKMPQQPQPQKLSEQESEESQTSSAEESFECLVKECNGQGFLHLSGLTGHLEKSHLFHLLDSETCMVGAEVVSADSQRRSYSCPSCYTKLPGEPDMEEHFQKNHKDINHQFQCKDCPETFYMWGSYIAHVSIIHKTYLNEDFPSSLLVKSSDTLDVLKELWQDMDKWAVEKESEFLTGTSVFANQCALCCKVYRRLYDGIWHLVMHHQTPVEEINRCLYVRYAKTQTKQTVVVDEEEEDMDVASEPVEAEPVLVQEMEEDLDLEPAEEDNQIFGIEIEDIESARPSTDETPLEASTTEPVAQDAPSTDETQLEASTTEPVAQDAPSTDETLLEASTNEHQDTPSTDEKTSEASTPQAPKPAALAKPPITTSGYTRVTVSGEAANIAKPSVAPVTFDLRGFSGMMVKSVSSSTSVPPKDAQQSNTSTAIKDSSASQTSSEQVVSSSTSKEPEGTVSSDDPASQVPDSGPASEDHPSAETTSSVAPSEGSDVATGVVVCLVCGEEDGESTNQRICTNCQTFVLSYEPAAFGTCLTMDCPITPASRSINCDYCRYQKARSLGINKDNAQRK